MTSCDSGPRQRSWQRARTEPDGIAYRAKRLGLYREQTWAGYARDAARAAVSGEV